MLDAILLSGLNHLLQGADWASARLKPFAGRQARFEMSPFNFALTIGADGLFLPALNEVRTDVTVSLPPDTPFLLSQGLDKVMAVARVEGNAEFATELSFVFRQLRWDIEEDLSQVVGDIAAHRLVESAQRFAAWQKQAATNLLENISEYLVQENPMLVASGEYTTLARDIGRFSAALSRVEGRLAAL